jgi:hypothetical protein
LNSKIILVKYASRKFALFAAPNFNRPKCS